MTQSSYSTSGPVLPAGAESGTQRSKIPAEDGVKYSEGNNHIPEPGVPEQTPAATTSDTEGREALESKTEDSASCMRECPTAADSSPPPEHETGGVGEGVPAEGTGGSGPGSEAVSGVTAPLGEPPLRPVSPPASAHAEGESQREREAAAAAQSGSEVNGGSREGSDREPHMASASTPPASGQLPEGVAAKGEVQCPPKEVEVLQVQQSRPGGEAAKGSVWDREEGSGELDGGCGKTEESSLGRGVEGKGCQRRQDAGLMGDVVSALEKGNLGSKEPYTIPDSEEYSVKASVPLRSSQLGKIEGQDSQYLPQSMQVSMSSSRPLTLSLPL